MMNGNVNRENIRSVILLYQEALACLEVASKYLQNSGGCADSSIIKPCVTPSLPPPHITTTTHQPHLLGPGELWTSPSHDQLLRPLPCNATYEITDNSKDESVFHPTKTLSSHFNYSTHNCGCEYSGAGLNSTCHYDADFAHEGNQNYAYVDANSCNASNDTFSYTSANYHCVEKDSSPQLDIPEVVEEGVPMEEAWFGYEQPGSTWKSDLSSGEERAMHTYATEQVPDTETVTQQDVAYDQATSVWSSLSPPSSKRSSSGIAGVVQDQSVDHAVIEGLLDRCDKIINSVQAQLQSDNPVIKESLVSLLRSLELQQRLLSKKKRSLVVRPEPECVPGIQQPLSQAPTAQRFPTMVQHNTMTASQEHLDLPAYDDAHDSAAAAVATMRSLPSSSEGLQGVVGMEDVKHVLQEAFVWPLQFPQLFQGQSLQTWSRLLLYGPPGTGKTRLARALAEELRCPLYTVAPSAVLSSWLGSSEKIIRELFRRARCERGPVVVFIDEMDALCRTRSLTEDDCTRRIKTELLVHMDNNRSNNSQVRATDFKSPPHENECYSNQGTDKNKLPNNNSPFIRPPGYVSNNCKVCPATNCDNHNFSSSKNAPADCPQSLSMNQPSRNSYINSSARNVSASNFGENFRHRQDSVSDYDVFQMSDEPQDGATKSSCRLGRDCVMDAEYGDGYDTGTNQMFIIAATNCPWDIDPAFLRRFQKRCYVALPDSAARQALLKAALSGCRTDIDTDSWDDVLTATEGFSGADLTTVATAAAFRPIRELHSSRYWQFAEGNLIMPCSSDTLGAMQFTLDMLPRHRVTVRPVRAEDLVAATSATSRSVPAELLQRYHHFAAL